MKKAIAIMDKHNALTDSVDRARHYGAIARDALGVFSKLTSEIMLIEIVDFSIERAY